MSQELRAEFWQKMGTETQRYHPQHPQPIPLPPREVVQLGLAVPQAHSDARTALGTAAWLAGVAGSSQSLQ